jgi:hypothetical protein
MTPEVFLTEVVDPGLMLLWELQGPAPTASARRMLLAIAMQESGPGLSARYQGSPSTTPGPARGWWQFEQGGGTRGVLEHARSKDHALNVCGRLEVQPHPAAVWRALEGHDQLACCFARLLLWTDPREIPVAEADAWQGKPHPEMWPGNWATASEMVDRGAAPVA